jgi:hypothetical protein
MAVVKTTLVVSRAPKVQMNGNKPFYPQISRLGLLYTYIGTTAVLMFYRCAVETLEGNLISHTVWNIDSSKHRHLPLQ